MRARIFVCVIMAKCGPPTFTDRHTPTFSIICQAFITAIKFVNANISNDECGSLGGL